MKPICSLYMLQRNRLVMNALKDSQLIGADSNIHNLCPEQDESGEVSLFIYLLIIAMF